MLPEVLRVLRESGESRIHASMVTQEDELKELSPAEVLAGCPFVAREELDADQKALLKLSQKERFAVLKEVFGEPSRQHAMG
jgi:hypothetical protein